MVIGDARKTLAELAEASGIKPGTLRRRIEAGEIEPSRVFAQRAIRHAPRIIAVNGVEKTLVEWAASASVHYTTICRRIAEGWSLEDAFTRKNATGWRLGKRG